MPDLTQDPKVLEACGFELHIYADTEENYWTKDGACRGKRPHVTHDELFVGLCAVCKEKGFPQPTLNGMDAVNIDPRGPIPGCSIGAIEAGSLRNAIAAAILWVLERKKNERV